MNRGAFRNAAVLLALGLFGCGSEASPPAPPEPAPVVYDWGLPPGYPKPKVPADNPMTKEKVELGRFLFYDKRLSENQTQSCATCHDQKLAFTDGRAHGLGSTGEEHPRSPMSIVNVGFYSTLTWANPLVLDLEQQALLPLFGESPVELGMAGKEDLLLGRLRADSQYVDMFAAAYPGEADAITLKNVVRAIASFERTVISYRSPWDRYNYGGDPTALSEAAKRGKDLFFSEKLECFHCHGGFNFSDSVAHDGSTFVETMFHNTGLYNIGGTGAYPDATRGVYDITHVETDMGRFRAPTLRNIALTAPYMHDGSAGTLSDVLDHYAAGGRTIDSGPYAGVGSENPYKSELINGFSLTTQEKIDVMTFLQALTDEELVTDPRFSDPFVQGGNP